MPSDRLKLKLNIDLFVQQISEGLNMFIYIFLGEDRQKMYFTFYHQGLINQQREQRYKQLLRHRENLVLNRSTSIPDTKEFLEIDTKKPQFLYAIKYFISKNGKRKHKNETMKL